MTELRRAIDDAAARLSQAGVSSSRHDALELAAHVAGTDRGRLALLDAPPEHFFGSFDALVGQRAQRVPLQHLVGTAAFGPVTVQVGPGVFIPRPETESILEWVAAEHVRDQPVFVDLCTGSAALALALARKWPDAHVIAVDDSPAALTWARRNIEGTTVELRDADVTQPGLLAELDGRVDVVVANPPYVPDGAVLDREVAEHDPPHALFGGPDGMTVIRAIARLAGRWLRSGGRCAVEHDDTTSDLTIEAFARTAQFTDVTAHRDLTGRPRFVTARRA